MCDLCHFRGHSIEEEVGDFQTIVRIVLTEASGEDVFDERRTQCCFTIPGICYYDQCASFLEELIYVPSTSNRGVSRSCPEMTDF